MKESRDSGEEMVTAAHRGSTVRRRLLVLAIAGTLPIVVAIPLLLDQIYQQERRVAEAHFIDTARALSLVIDNQLGQIEATLRTLATSRALKADNFDEFDAQAHEVDPGDGSWIVLSDLDGHQLVNTRVPRGGAPLPGVVQNEGTREARARLNNGDLFISNRIGTAPNHIPVIAVIIPVLDRTGKPFDLSMLVPVFAFNRVFSDQKLPASWIGAIIDRKAVILTRSRGQEKLKGVPLPDWVARAFATKPEGILPGTAYEGRDMVFSFSRSPISGWTFGVAVPQAEVAATARRAVFATAAVGLGLLGIGALAAFRISRGIVGPLEALASRAAALGENHPLPPAPTGLVEVDLAAEAMRQAGESLRQLAATLEHRVTERTRDLEEANRRLVEEIEERQRAERRLARVQRMEAVGQLTGGVAHDFNNLLQAVIGNLDLLRRRLSDAGDLRMTDNALLAAERGANLTRQLLAFARQQHLEPGPVDLNALIQGMVGILRGALGGAVIVQIQLMGDLWTALADRGQIESIILNLAINARDAMPAGGHITIGTDNVTREAPERPEEPDPGDYVELSVVDEGDGISPDVIAKVFEPFFTTKEVGKGSGLGLSQVLGIAKQHGGGVAIESAVGMGTTVRVFLPKYVEREKTEMPVAQTAVS